MKKKRDSFVFYRSYFEIFRDIDQKQKEELIYAICEYGLNRKKINFEDKAIETMFKLIKPLLDANYKKYVAGCKGGAPKGNQNAKKKIKAVTVEEITEECATA